MEPDFVELNSLPPAYRAILQEVLASIAAIKRTGWGTIHIEIKDHKRWHVRHTVSVASSTTCN